NRDQFRGLFNDVVLFGRDWGFRLHDVDVPVRWWHGDADSLVPLEHARRVTDLLPDCELLVRPEESHLGGFGVSGDVFSWLTEVAARRPRRSRSRRRAAPTCGHPRSAQRPRW